MKYCHWGAIALLGLFAAPALAVHKCVEESGRIFYQDAPCPAHTRGGEMNRNVNRTFSGQVARPDPNGGITIDRERKD